MAVRSFTKKPVKVEAEQFRGWSGVEEIVAWIPGSFFVPTGYEHHLRRPHEFDRSRGDVLDDARSYLVIRQAGEVTVRVDEYDWIIKEADGTIRILDTEDLKQQYDLDDGESNLGLVVNAF